MLPTTVHDWQVSRSVRWSLDRPHVLAILNLTPDSFSDGGSLGTVDDAVRAAAGVIDAGADGLDIGGESTRPGADRISPDEQIRRVVPAIQAIRRHLGASGNVAGPVITIDTTSAQVARAALDAGADAINDVAAATEDPAMLPLSAERGCGIILMHRLAPPGRDVFSHQYTAPPNYRDHGGVVGAVLAHWRERLIAAAAAGIAHDAIVLDPGLGFGKTVEQNLELIARARELLELGRPILSGISRKSFTAKAAGLDTARPPRERVHASVGLSIAHLAAGARIFRVHDVREHVDALRAAWTVLTVRSDGPGHIPA